MVRVGVVSSIVEFGPLISDLDLKSENDSKEIENSNEVYCFEMLDVLLWGWRIFL